MADSKLFRARRLVGRAEVVHSRGQSADRPCAGEVVPKKVPSGGIPSHDSEQLGTAGRLATHGGIISSYSRAQHLKIGPAK